jgi:membrane protein required for colicin V production
MDGFTLVDGIVAGVIVISALLAFSRGLVREVMAIAGWIAAAIVAFLFAGEAEPLLKELPYVGPILQDSCELAIIAAFAAVFAVTLIVVSVFTPLFSGLIQRTALGGVDQGLGFLFGAVRGILLVAVALLAYERIMVSESMAMVEDSRSAAVFASLTTQIEAQIPEDATGWIVARYEELVGTCGAG